MKLIKLTSLNGTGNVYVNADHIGHIYQVKETYGSKAKPKHTRIGVLTHNNGGFEVTETVDTILKMSGMAN